jgi:hypothetical protein
MSKDMTDTSSDEAPRPGNDTVQALKELANSPRLLKVANTAPIVQVGGSVSSTNTSATNILDVRQLAETVMFEATRLVATLDEFGPEQVDQTARAEADMVPISAVLRGGAAITAAFAFVCIAGTQVSGTVFLHPLLAWFLILASIGFYLMAKVKR